MTISEAGTSVAGDEEREASLRAMEQVGWHSQGEKSRTAAATAALQLGDCEAGRPCAPLVPLRQQCTPCWHVVDTGQRYQTKRVLALRDR
jgi:hypothetical protein